MFRSRSDDPFRLSVLSRLSIAASWIRGPAVLTRWLVAGLTVCLLIAATGVAWLIVMPSPPIVSVMVTRPTDSPPTPPSAAWLPPTWDTSHAGPSSSRLLDVPGVTDCRPLAAGNRFPTNLFGEPVPVVIGSDGVLWGPRCVVSAGVASS